MPDRPDPGHVPYRTRPTWLGAFGAALALGVLLGTGCGEEKKTTLSPGSSIQLDSIYLTNDSVPVGGVVSLYALPTLTEQQYAWSASTGRFLAIDGYYAQWKAPDTPAIARITVVAFNDSEESRALSAPIAVDTYLPRNEPTYTGASYCGLECHGVEGHGSHYDTWVNGAHARAYEGLESDASFQLHAGLVNPNPSPCALCHTVGFGDRNAQGWDRHNGGYDEVAVARLQGVQCENCHGPLSDRYGEILPDHGTRAIGDSLFAVGTPADPVGCASCHNGWPSTGCSSTQCHPERPPQWPYGKSYLNEWVYGAHDRIAPEVDLGNPECVQCHTAQGFVARITTGGPPISPPQNPLPITCAACHDPHGSDFVADLRVSPDQDICGRCHTDEGAGYPAQPHTPQAQLLAGGGGFEYPDVDYPSSPHQTLMLQGDVAHRGCVHCHYRESVGRSHDFTADPASCVACHPESNGLSFAWNHRTGEIRNLLTALRNKLAAASPADSLTEAFRRADFNYLFVDRDHSLGAHNYLYTRALLDASLANFDPTPGR
jgi:predicted CXXCH cytochrome family protein